MQNPLSELIEYVWKEEPEAEDRAWGRGLLIVILTLVVLGVLCSLVRAGSWGPAGCPQPASVEVKATWKVEEAGWWYKRVGGSVVGAWNPTTGQWIDWDGVKWSDGGRWSWDTKKGWSQRAEVLDNAVENFGVYMGKSILAPAYSLGGVACSRLEALTEIGKPVIPDDTSKEHWTAVGPVEWTTPIVAELKAVAGDRAVVKGYLAANWVVTDKLYLNESDEFKRTGRAVVVQDPDGTAVHIQYAWASGDADVIGDGEFRKIPNLVKDHQALVDSHKVIVRGVEEAQVSLAAAMKQVAEAVEALKVIRAQVEELRSFLPNQGDLKKDLEALKAAVATVVWVSEHKNDFVFGGVLIIGGIIFFLIRKK